jgi:tRNA 5-methylaminomethyl-2-thiouridine biosynthesis bifunctional protein
MLPALETDLEPCPQWLGRSSIRCQSEDYLPLIGRLASPSNIAQHYAGLRDGKLHDYPLLQPIEGLYINLAYGSHGFSYALLGAEILASELNNEPAPCARTTLENLNPIRFFIRQLKRGKI